MEHKKRKLGVLDLLVIIAVLAVVAAAVYYFTHNEVGNSAASSGKNQISYVLEIQDVPASFADQIIIGDSVYESQSDAYIGKVTAAKLVPYRVDAYQKDRDTVVAKEVQGKYCLRVTVTALADISAASTEVNSIPVMVGSQVNVRTSTVGGVSYCIKLEEPDYDD